MSYHDEVTNLLQDVRELIYSPDKWTTKAFARDAKGEEVSSYKKACSYCLAGAFHYVELDYFPSVGTSARHLVEIALKKISAIDTFTSFNDSRDHNAVIDLLTTSIHMSEQTTS